MDRTPSSEPYPPPPEPPAPARTNAGLVALIAIGGALMAIGAFLPRAKLTIGPLYVKTEGVAWLLAVIGIVILVLAVVLRTRTGAVILLVISGLALLLTIAAMSGVKSDLEHWAVTTGASQVAAQFGLSQSTVASRIQSLIDSGQSHLTYQVGLYMALVGSVLALVASVLALFSTRKPKAVPIGPPLVASASSVPSPAAPGGPPAPAAAPTDWTAPPAGTPPPTAPPAQPAAPPPAQPATPEEEPESLPPPPPPPPS